MTKKNVPKHIFTLMADDIREEKNNKLSVIGIYGNDIISKVMPCILPKLCFLTRTSGGEGEYSMKLSLKGPDGVEHFTDKNEIRVVAPPEGVGNLNIYRSPFIAKEEGVYTYTIFIDDAEFCSFAFTVKAGKVT